MNNEEEKKSVFFSVGILVIAVIVILTIYGVFSAFKERYTEDGDKKKIFSNIIKYERRREKGS